ncbi:MAG: HD-GYP domain-containing protein [Thermoanaerobaculia bacterium]
MRKSLDVVYHHHEKLDGSGYPSGISGDEISLAVRIVTIADIFDALTSERSYRRRLKSGTAFEILEEGVGKRWWDGNVLAPQIVGRRDGCRRLQPLRLLTPS